MKKILIILIVTGMAFTASAQRFHGRLAPSYPHSRVVVSTGFYSPYSPYGYYGPMYPYPYGYVERPTRLELKIEDIRNDYSDRIWSARQSLKGKEKRRTIHQLKHDRDQAIIDVKRNYYKTGR
jgi:hypothetical protein